MLGHYVPPPITRVRMACVEAPRLTEQRNQTVGALKISKMTKLIGW